MTLVADFNPGIDAETAFKSRFVAGGGQVVETIRVPLRSPELGPYIQRLKDAKPDAVFLWVPSGEHTISFMKHYRERGLAAAGTKIIATGDLTDEQVLPAMGDGRCCDRRDHYLPLFGGARLAAEQGFRERFHGSRTTYRLAEFHGRCSL